MPKVVSEHVAYPVLAEGETRPPGVIEVVKRTIEEDDGAMREQYVWQRGEFVVVVPFTDDGKVVVIEEFKYGVMEPLLTFPAGGIKRDENPAQAAQREMIEETGYTFRYLDRLPWHYRVSPDKSTEGHYVYVVQQAIRLEGHVAESGAVMEISPHQLLQHPQFSIALMRMALHEALVYIRS